MRRWRRITVVLAVLIAIPVAFVFRARQKSVRQVEIREAAYQSVLRSFTSVLTPGMTRRDVQTHLTQSGKSFHHSSSGGRASFILVKIGEEEHPWYCSANNVYLRFGFKRADPARLSSTDADTLAGVDIDKQLEGCL
jgi:hypothetical protein